MSTLILTFVACGFEIFLSLPYLVENNHQFALHIIDHIVIERRWEVDHRMADIDNDHDDVRDLQNSPPIFCSSNKVRC